MKYLFHSPETTTDPKAGSKKKGKATEKDDKTGNIKEDKPIKMSSKEKLTKNAPKKRTSNNFSRSFILKSIEKLNTDSELQLQLTYVQDSLFYVFIDHFHCCDNN